jgi:hypothetical protein
VLVFRFRKPRINGNPLGYGDPRQERRREVARLTTSRSEYRCPRAYGGGINDSGQVTGALCNSTTAGAGQAFIGTASSITIIPLPAGWTSAYTSTDSINDLDDMVGGGMDVFVILWRLDMGPGMAVRPSTVWSTLLGI